MAGRVKFARSGNEVVDSVAEIFSGASGTVLRIRRVVRFALTVLEGLLADLFGRLLASGALPASNFPDDGRRRTAGRRVLVVWRVAVLLAFINRFASVGSGTFGWQTIECLQNRCNREIDKCQPRGDKKLLPGAKGVVE
jgi:hypothetical protein